jgi:hypothetical protein
MDGTRLSLASIRRRMESCGSENGGGAPIGRPDGFRDVGVKAAV